MIIRPAVAQDRPAIIELLRLSLGESTIPKSEALWSWKHEQNPFGPSYVLVAEEAGHLTGLRAFMQWHWQRNGQVYQTVRAVDTATHPDHQGKGIFTQLTRHELESCRRDNRHFVFNTPNDQSLPGYLKMGWVKLGVMPLKCRFRRPLPMAWANLVKKSPPAANAPDPTPMQRWTHDIYDLAAGAVVNQQRFTTVLSPQYISWRYGSNPLYRYSYFTDQENYLLIHRVKDHKFGRELRLVDFVLTPTGATRRDFTKRMRKTVSQFCNEQRIHFISCSAAQYRLNKRWLHWLGLWPAIKAGPLVTLRDLNMKDAFGEVKKMRNWGFSLGDMELF